MQREEERLYVLLCIVKTGNTWIIMLYMVIQHAYSYLISTILMSSSAKCKSAKNKKNWLSSSHLFKFLDLSLLKHGEHVGVGSLCAPLLGFLGGLLAQGEES